MIMPEQEYAIEIKNLSKKYRLGSIGHGTLYRDLQSWWARVNGAEDPNGKIYGHERVDPNASFMALNDVSFSVKRGDVVGIIGKNGAGKSTVLKLLSRITGPTSGSIRLNGRVASLLEVGTGFHSELTGRENVYLNGAILGMTRKEIASKFDEIVAFSELEQFIDTPVKRYSSGMTVRLAFSVAAHLEAEILLVDEVLAVGDLAFRKKCMGKMRDISTKSGRTILFVSHDMTAIQNICTSGIVLSNGEVSYDGSASEAVRHYISQNSSQNKILEWLPSKSYPFSEVFTPQRFAIEGNDFSVAGSTLFGGNSYSVVIEGTLLQNDPRLIMMVGFYSADKTLLFVSDIYDKGNFSFDQVKRGPVKFTVPVPSEILLNAGYEIELMCCLHHVGWILPPDNASRLSFDYMLENDPNPYALENRLGALAPRISWKVEEQ